MIEIEIQDLENLPKAASEFIESMRPGMVYTFYGPMGAGKTTFISEVCRLLNTPDDVNSPTFSIVNEYDTEVWGPVYHLDCYRLENEEEAFDIGVEDCLNSGRTCFVEWPERVEGLLPRDNVVRVEIELNPVDGARKLVIH